MTAHPWKRAMRRMLAQVERGVEEHRRPADPDAPVEIHPYRGYGTRELLHVNGRVLRQPRIALGEDRGTPWANLVATFRRLASGEVAGATVIATYAGREVRGLTDGEGYFHLVIDVRDLDLGGGLRHAVALRTLAPRSREEAVAEVIVPPPSAQFGVVSDIDDTIVETNATSLVRMARTVFLQNARGRVAMEGVAAFYRALQAGPSGGDDNPLFYVSSSPWNFYDLLDQFLEVSGIPSGPLMLQDFGVDDETLIHGPHDRHKLTQIAEILTAYPHLPFVLIGDSGQRDPEIYRQAVLAHPGRIRAVYIRDVTPAARDAAVRSIAEELTAAGVETALIATTAEAAAHARAAGLIR